jgi:hypothetical protein
MKQISVEAIRGEIMSNKSVQQELRKLAEKVLQDTKQELIQEFDNHPVTKEIEAGADAQNQSGTLGRKGNLFSFIGFNEGADPLSPVRKLLQKISLSSLSPSVRGQSVQFKVQVPDREEFEAVTKMPWESGRSWLYDIERAISGLGYYLYGRFSKSRSGAAVQAENSVTSMTFTPVKYFGDMIERFSQKLK